MYFPICWSQAASGNSDLSADLLAQLLADVLSGELEAKCMSGNEDLNGHDDEQTTKDILEDGQSGGKKKTFLLDEIFRCAFCIVLLEVSSVREYQWVLSYSTVLMWILAAAIVCCTCSANS